MDSAGSPGPLALYRRYRPETFAEVIGQDHVTTPLRAALANNRVNHAYLFSGPRGCGKTTSARILARALNCEKAPIADPCGECESCRDLARGGPGSIDVIEIDAASHGGVDDARDLREKAFFAPVKSRYKVYIIDEAHMVSTQGFNALLKLVEEPPEHLRFIFATTEPEKVIPTIRSRTHHYPFRLIPPKLLSGYLSEICTSEGVAVEPAALPLVVRAGAGSARDTLSVMDQLLGGAGPEGVTYELAAGLLGYTPDTLLDEAVDAFAAGDGASVFGVVDKVIETGQDPRRFTEDLLRRLRDLVIISAVPEATASGLIDVASDAAERLEAQARRFGASELSRAADLVATGLTEMRGATAPRLLLELICARVLLPGADGAAGLGARVDRLERRLAVGGSISEAPAPAAPVAPAQDRPERAPSVGAPDAQPTPPAPGVGGPAAARAAIARDAADAGSPPRETPPAQPPAPPSHEVAPPSPPTTEPPDWSVPPAASPTSVPAPDLSDTPAAPASGGAPAGFGTVDVRRVWPDIVESTKSKKRLAWMHLTQNSQVMGLEGDVLTLGFVNQGARDSFANSGSDAIVAQAVVDVIGAQWKINAIVAPGAQPGVVSAGPSGSGAAQPAGAQDATRPQETPNSAEAPPWATSEPAAPSAGPGEPPAPDWSSPDNAAGFDDEVTDDDSLGGAELLARELGATVIEEIPHQQ
ncbi:DNA polymerase III subunit gamma and tau [Nocardioides sp. Kera G14]|nr:DNA polymerase III subunit gamma and tau [Nocardioides sp. Kera G14]UDY23721.1 DNA polymerase III subunit gamma and tau [Nocardioides sp. Kera G14]